MKREANLSAVRRRGRSFHSFRGFTIGIILIFMLTSCAAPVASSKPTQILPEPTMTLTEALPPTKTSPTATHTITPTKAVDYQSYSVEIKETQEPIVMTTSVPTSAEYLYKDVIVTFKTPWMIGQNYLNLDDLGDSTPENSDVVLVHGTGSETTYSLHTGNGATYYYSGLYGMNFNTCLEHFPFTNMDLEYYSYQSMVILSGRDYCILTSEGHLAILHFEPSSRYLYSADNNYLMPEVVVTAYKRNVLTDLAALPTINPALTPASGRYAGLNLTRSQENGLDKAAQTFLDTINSGDRKAVANLMLYPLSIGNSSEYYGIVAKDQSDFLSVYSEIFTPQVIQEFKNATVSENMGVHYNGAISLVVPHCAIFFYPDGNISAIYEDDNGVD